MSELPEVWEEIRLGSLCHITTGDKDVNQGNPNGTYPFFTCARDITGFDTYSFSGEAILIAGNGFFNVKKFNGKFEAYQRTYVLQDFKVNYQYLYYFIDHRLSDVTKDSRGSTVKYIRIGNLTEYQVRVPPLNEQHRIVAKIEELFSELEKGVESLKTAKAQLAVYRQSVLKAAMEGELLAQINDVPVQLVELERVISSLDQGWSPKCKNEPAASEAEWAVIKTSAVQHATFVEEENKALPSNLEPRSHLEIQQGELLITRAGPRTRVGVCCLVRKTRGRLMICDKVYRIRCGDSILPEYLEAALNSPSILDELESLKSGISDSGVNLTQGRFKQLNIPLPTTDIQHQIVQEIESRFSVVEKMEQTIEESLQKAEALRQSILKRAFESKLVPQDPTDEPASELLARIKAEREATNIPKRGRKKA